MGEGAHCAGVQCSLFQRELYPLQLTSIPSLSSDGCSCPSIHGPVGCHTSPNHTKMRLTYLRQCADGCVPVQRLWRASLGIQVSQVERKGHFRQEAQPGQKLARLGAAWRQDRRSPCAGWYLPVPQRSQTVGNVVITCRSGHGCSRGMDKQEWPRAS